MSHTLIMGASPNPSRYAYRAAYALHSRRLPFLLFGILKGEVFGQPILHTFPSDADVDTITLYMSAPIQKQYYEAMIALKPRRIIFNPGTENPEFEEMVEAAGIEAISGCTLVMLGSGQW